MKEKSPQSYLEEFETEGIAEDSFMAIQVARLRALGAPATEAVRSTHRTVAKAAALGAACLVAGTVAGGIVFSHRN